MNRYKKLTKLSEDWKKLARKKFADAEREDNEMGKRLIEHGAICYVNCYKALETVLKDEAPITDCTMSETNA